MQICPTCKQTAKGLLPMIELDEIEKFSVCPTCNQDIPKTYPIYVTKQQAIFLEKKTESEIATNKFYADAMHKDYKKSPESEQRDNMLLDLHQKLKKTIE